MVWCPVSGVAPEKYLAMTSALKISVGINFVALGAVVFLVASRGKTVPHPESVSPETLVAVAPSSAAPVAATFRWSDLESTDYRAYIANLRGVGCPEATVHDIITADVDAAIFAPSREQLKRDDRRSAGGLELALQQLSRDESALVANLMGVREAASAQVASQSPTPTRAHRGRPETAIAVPVAFQDPAALGMKLNNDQLNAIKDLRESFVEQIGGPNQDPKDPAYRERWQKAQLAINDELKALLGTSAYQTLQFEAQSAALPANAAGK